MRFLTRLVCLLTLYTANAQKNDNVWLLGYDANMNPNDNFCFNIIRFDSGSPEIEIRDDIEVDIDKLMAGYCNDEGELLAYFNGTGVYNAQHQLMQNGGGMNDFTQYNYAALSAIMLDKPGSDQQELILISSRIDFMWEPVNDAVTRDNFYSIIDVAANNGAGKVVQKLQLLVDDTLNYGRVAAIRHGNGRDWWVLVNERNTNSYYSVLIDPLGPRVYQKQSTGQPVPFALGQATFSPDGTMFATLGSIDDTQGSYLDLYNFDRCTGLLSNHRRHHWTGLSYGLGACFSPNNRFLYVAANWEIFQYDLWAADWVASRVSVAYYDGFESPLPARFFSAQLAPDNKIYISTINGTDYLHVIHSPNEPGLNCQVEQHGLFLGCYHYLTVPNYPHFRLYDMSNSPCDTLGINPPLSGGTDIVDGRAALKVAPNPVTNGKIAVSLARSSAAIALLQLYNATGTLVLEQIPPQQGLWQMEWTLPKLPAGTYFLHVEDSDGKRQVAAVQVL